MVLIFVYGTLKRGCRNHHYLAGQQFLGEARTAPGFTLYSLGEYPGMVRSADPAQQVDGELWSVDAAGLVRLDELEGVDERLYSRESIELEAPFAERFVQTYLYLRDLSGRPAIGAVWRE